MKAIKQPFDTKNFGKTDRANELMDAMREPLSYWRYVNTSSLIVLHKSVAVKEYEESKQISRERYCYSKHPKFAMVFCRRKPGHEGKHRSYSGIRWDGLIGSKRC